MGVILFSNWVPLTSAACQWGAAYHRGSQRLLTRAAAVMLLILVAGCGSSSTVTGRGGTGGSVAATTQQRAEILFGTMETLFSLEAYEFGQAEQLVMSRLNQWLRGQEIKIPWQREPRLDELSPKPTSIRGVRSLADNTFLYKHDFDFLNEAVWMRRIGDHVRDGPSGPPAKSNETSTADDAARKSPLQFTSADDPEELRLAMRLFDWTIAHVQLEADTWPENSDYKLPRNWHTPYETVLLGRGTASDRAWTFILLARQQGLDVFVLGLGDPEKPAELKPWIPALALARGDGDKKETDLYLFDPALGLPIPGAGGQGIATLAQVAADDALLRQLDLDDKRPYPIKAADIQQVTALVEASPGYLSRRMKLLESRLSGQHRLVLSVSPQAIEEKLAGAMGASAAKHVRPRVALWTRPYETLRLRETEDENLLRVAQAELTPLQSLLRPVEALATDRKTTARREESPEWTKDSQQKRPAQARLRVALGVGRMLQLAGNYDHETGAIRYLQQAIAPPDYLAKKKRDFIEDLRSKLPRPDDPATKKQIEQIADNRVHGFRRADESAKLWIGQIKAAQGEFATATDYFTRWENAPWQPSINYSLARIHESQGNLAKAVEIYRQDDSPQRPGNLLRARRLEKLQDDK